MEGADWEKLAKDAKVDQGMAAFEDTAKLLGGYYRALLREGIEHDLAAEMILQYQQSMLDRQGKPSDGLS